MATETQKAAGPRSRPAPSGWSRVYALLVSPKLAIALLVGVLSCCVVGVTVFRGARAWELIFSTLWFNACLALLAVSSGAAFFSRIWKRRLTTVSVGMIVFHLSFVSLLGGVIYNSLFHFKGLMRLTEGETLPNGRLESYDTAEAGRLFDFASLRGETTLVRMHRDFKVAGANKRAAYEIVVRDGAASASGIIYITEYLAAGGIRYFCSKEGYSVVVAMAEKAGRQFYAAAVPLQSLPQADGGILYATGTATNAGAFAFPAPPATPRLQLLLSYTPDREERSGQVHFQALPLDAHGEGDGERTVQVAVGGEFDAGEYWLSPREIRYWVGMEVRYDPAQTVILASLCFGLLGMFVILVGRLRQGPRKRAA